MSVERALAITGRTTDDDVRWLAEQARTRPVIVELGPYQGRSTRALGDACPGVVYAIDNWSPAINDWQLGLDARAACYDHLADLIDRGTVRLIEHDSQEGVPPELTGVVADMLWIDADHSYEAVAADIRHYAPLVRPGGLVCGHDYSVWHPDVQRAVDEAYGNRVHTLDIHRSIWWVHV